jgi:hypothetical protein
MAVRTIRHSARSGIRDACRHREAHSAATDQYFYLSDRPVTRGQRSLIAHSFGHCCVFEQERISMTQSASNQAFLLMLIILALGSCFIRAFWEIEEARGRLHRHRKLVREARSTVGPGH